MLSRQHSFYQQFLQLVDAALICLALWAGHALRFYVLNQSDWFAEYTLEPEFKNCYWMMALALPLGPIALEYMGLYQIRTSGEWARALWQILSGLFLVLIAI